MLTLAYALLLALSRKVSRPMWLRPQASLSKFPRWDVPSNDVPPSAAVASRTGDSMINPADPIKSKSSSQLRRGKWKAEQQFYAIRVLQDLNSAFLNAPEGTSLKSYLSEKLHCEPERIRIKFKGYIPR